MGYLKELASENLYYKPLTLEYVPAWTQFLTDPLNTQFYPKLNYTPEERATLWIGAQIERYANGQFGLYALHLKSNDEFIGQCGLLTQIIDEKEEIEIGYHLFSKYRGKGFATEAAIHFRQCAIDKQITKSVISIIDVKNVASQAVAKRNGMIQEMRTNWRDKDVFVYRYTI